MIDGSPSLHPTLSGPTMAYLRSRVAFRCVAPDAPPPVTYELVKDQNFPISSGTDLQGDQPASFYLKVTMTSGGLYHCRARTDEAEGVSNSIRLTVVIPPFETRVTSVPFPPVAYEGSRVVLSCNVSQGSHLSYSWFYNRKELLPFASPLLRTQGSSLVIEKVKPEHAGYYSCMAWSTVQDIKRFSSSTEVQLTVKVYLSQPQISFSISKEVGGFMGNISCSVSRGSPPINFTFLLENRAEDAITVSESHLVHFSFPIVPGLEMGKARCRAQTEVQDILSEPLSVEVVPVGGHVKVQVEYLYRADHKATSAKLGCQISQGTFPFVVWLHNGSILPSDSLTNFHIPQTISPFAFANLGQTLIIAELGPQVFGHYRCRTRDSYDDTGPWVESEDVLVQIRGASSPCPKPLPAPPTAALPTVSTPTIESISIAFCCFVLLALVVGVTCVCKMVDQRQELQVTGTNLVDMSPSAQASNSEAVEENPHQMFEATV